MVENDKYLLTVLRYIHQNPLKAGIVEDINEYIWSSYSEYLNKNKKHIVDEDFILVIFALNSVSDGRVARQFSRLNIFNEIERLENIQENSLRWEDIKLDEDSITIETNRKSIKAQLEGNEFRFYDDNNEPLEIDIKDGKNVSFKDEQYKNLKLPV